MSPAVIYGGGKLGAQFSRLARLHFPEIEIVGCIDDTRPAGEKVFGDVPVLGGLAEAVAGAYGPTAAGLIFAIGYGDIRGRLAALRRAQAAGYQLVSLHHPRAMVETGAEIGPGTVIAAGAVIDAGVRMGCGNFIDIGVRIGEDTVLGDGNYLSAGSTVAGSCRLGDGNFLGLDVTVVNDRQIGTGNFVNAKTLVHRDLADGLQVIQVHNVREMAMRG
ncbi:MAG: hypothetical protein ACPGO3_07900 [Magnetospiraceae bacterium]